MSDAIERRWGKHQAADPASVPVQPAATVVLIRDGALGLEVLLLQRHHSLAFAPGSWVFPGGRVDADEVEAAGDEEAAARRAAVREAHEESQLVVDEEHLVPFSHWTTPIGPKRRFATWFFLAPAPTGEVIVDDAEIVQHRWYVPSVALDEHRGGDLQLQPPTFVTVGWLTGYRDVASAVAAADVAGTDRFEPNIVADGPDLAALYPGDVGWESGDPTLTGRRHRLLLRADGRWTYLRDPLG